MENPLNPTVYKVTKNFKNVELRSSFADWKRNTADVYLNGRYAGRLYDHGVQTSGLIKLSFSRLHVWTMFSQRDDTFGNITQFLKDLRWRLHRETGNLVVYDYPNRHKHSQEIALDWISEAEEAQCGKFWTIAEQELNRRKASERHYSAGHRNHLRAMALMSA